MWKAFKNIESGVVHAVKMPEGVTPHGFAMNWPVIETEEPLSCPMCLRAAYEWRFRVPEFYALLPENYQVPGTSERRCGICHAPVSRCCC